MIQKISNDDFTSENFKFGNAKYINIKDIFYDYISLYSNFQNKSLLHIPKLHSRREIQTKQSREGSHNPFLM